MSLRSHEANINKILRADGEVLAFVGEVDMDSQLLAGAVRDFNVMVRRGLWQAQVAVWHTANAFTVSTGLVMLWQGEAQCQVGAETMHLQAGQGVWWQFQPTEWSWQPLSAESKLIAVNLQQLPTAP